MIIRRFFCKIMIQSFIPPVCLTVALLLSGCGDTTEPLAANTTIESTAESTAQDALSMIITVGGSDFSVTLADNETSRALLERLPLTLTMNELHGNEKYNYLSEALPITAVTVDKIQTGDLMLFGSDCIVLFYDSFSTEYSYTRIGSIDDPADLAKAVGTGNVSMTFSVK